LPSLSIQEKIYPVSLGFAQLSLVRIAIAWNDGVSEQVLSYSGVQWHLMAMTLLTAVITGIMAMLRLVEMQLIDVNHTAKMIQTIIKAALVLITLLNSVLVLAYKMRASMDPIPTLYAGLLDWELVKALDQAQLGKLIYNYGGAGLFVLFGLVYVIKRAALMRLDGSQENKSGLILQVLLCIITPLLVLLSGTHNAFLFFVFNLQFQLLSRWQHYLANKSPVPIWLLSMIIACLSHASFFLTGHTNSIASVDLSNAYVGVQEYDTSLIGLLTFCSNWSGSIWWAIAGWVLVADRAEDPWRDWFSHLVIQSTLFSVALALLSISVTVLREHLFIWTVFSPKYLYQIAWICLYHWLLQVVIGTAVTQVVFNGQLGIEEKEEEEEHDEDYME
jgi:ethanolaminephosphotransferase